MDGEADGKPVPQALWRRGVVPFIKIDKGLEDEDDGVQMMKPMPELDALLERAKSPGVFGTKERSVIDAPTRPASPSSSRSSSRSRAGARARPDADHRARSEHQVRRARAADRLLLAAILEELDEIPEGQQVMLKLSIPAEAGLFQPLVDHPKVLRVVALSGGFSRDEACRELAQNPGMIASFSRALLSDLRHEMSDEEFDRALGTAIDEIYAASVARCRPSKPNLEAVRRGGRFGARHACPVVDQGQGASSPAPPAVAERQVARPAAGGRRSLRVAGPARPAHTQRDLDRAPAVLDHRLRA